MNVFEFIKGIFSKDWEVDTRYEYYRKYFDKYGISLTDFDTILTLEDKIEKLPSLDKNIKDNSIFYTDKMVIKKSHKKELEDMRNFYKYNKELPNNSVQLSNTDVKQIRTAEARFLRLNVLLNRFNYEELAKTFLFSQEDAKYILEQLLKAPRDYKVSKIIDYLDRALNNMEQTRSENELKGIQAKKRAFIATVAYLYKKEQLVMHVDKPIGEYLTKNRVANLRKFLSNLISK